MRDYVNVAKWETASHLRPSDKPEKTIPPKYSHQAISRPPLLLSGRVGQEDGVRVMSFSTMSNGRQNGHAPTASTSTRPPPAPINFTSLLAQANSLNDAGGGDGELPQIRFGLSEIEQMSEAVAGRNRKGKARPGEG